MSDDSASSRGEKVALVESFFDGIVTGDLDRLPVGPELAVQSPLTSRLEGAAAREDVKTVAANTRAIRVVRHVVEGDHVASLTENDTANGPLTIFALFTIGSGRIVEVRVFYDTRQLAMSGD